MAHKGRVWARRPSPFRLATRLGARVAPQQSPILRTGGTTVHCWSVLDHPLPDCLEAKNLGGLGAEPPSKSPIAHIAAECALSSNPPCHVPGEPVQVLVLAGKRIRSE